MFNPQTWKSLANANVCRGCGTCAKPATWKKKVATGRCVSPTCTNDHLHHPTHSQEWLHFPLRLKDCQQRYAHRIVHPCMWFCNAYKVCWLRGGVFVDVIIFEIDLNVYVFWLSLHFWRLGGMPCPIGTLMWVWKLNHQLCKCALTHQKEMFKKGRVQSCKLGQKGDEEHTTWKCQAH